MDLKSIRWRLPLSYAGIALLAALALGIVLLSVLRGYYLERERFYLINTAQSMQASLLQMLEAGLDGRTLQAQLNSLAYISQTRLRVLDDDHNLLFDSGIPAPPGMLAGQRLASPPLAAPAEPGEFQATDDFVAAIPPPGADGLDILFQRVAPAQPGTPVQEGEQTPGYLLVMPGPASLYGFNWDLNPEVSGRRSELTFELPVMDRDGQILGRIMLSEGPAYGSAIVESVARAWAIAGGVAVFLAAGVGWWISRRLTQPLTALTQVTARMAQGDLSARARTEYADEFGALGQSFNHMASRVEETVAGLRQFVADAAHELQTPLTALRTDLEIAQAQPEPGRADRLERAQAQVERLSRLVEGLLDLSRLEADAQVHTHAPVDLAALLREASEPYAAQAEQKGISFTLDIPDALPPVLGNAGQLRRASGNLLENAIKFTQPGGAVTASLIEEGEWVRLWVQDTGIGIPEEDLGQLFDRFHRGRNAAPYPGSGLGLAIVRAIAAAHRGEVSAGNNPSGGSWFAIDLPIRD